MSGVAAGARYTLKLDHGSYPDPSRFQPEGPHFLDGFTPHLDEGCIGSINEIFDAKPPYTPRGCIAQAWSVAEVLRCYAHTAEESATPATSA